MDSFYDAPRRAPMPTQVEKFLPTPVVPEVSIVCSSKTSVNKYSSYSSWKMQQNRTETACISNLNKENMLKESVTIPSHQNQSINCPNSSQLLKKQVRFESPIQQQRPSLTYEPFNTRKNVTDNCPKTPVIVNKPLRTSQGDNLPLNGTTFQQMYLANVPNRHLDLSLIDLPIKSSKKDENFIETENQMKQTGSSNADFKKNDTVDSDTFENKENMLPKTYRQFLDTQKKIAKENKGNLNDSVTDIFNYKRKMFNNRETTFDDKKSWNGLTVSNLTKPVETDRPIFSKVIAGDNSKYGNGNNLRNCLDKPQIQPQFYESNRCFGINGQHFQDYTKNSPKYDRVTQTSDYRPLDNQQVDLKQANVPKNDSEPTNRDLLKIIAQQNEQLLILQRQVAMLLNRDEQHRPKQIEAAPRPSQEMSYLQEKCVTSTQNEAFRSPVRDVNSTPRKQRALSKFSIDLMTSFEVAIRPQHNKQNFVNQEPKIQEITESESEVRDSASSIDKYDKTLVDTSLHLQEPVKVREICPSPEPSININMNDYDSSDDDEVSASEIGATFYRNLMGQVNDILRKAHVQTKEDFKGAPGMDKLKSQAMSRVKEATLKHLKNIGVTIGPIEETNEEESFGTDGKDYTPTEISFAVKQLLLKYLPDEQLAKITYKQAQSAQNAKPSVIPNRPEFSFASVEYMKKYNLISNNKDIKPRDVEVPKAPIPQKLEGPKILDITALKMQPKLL